MSLTSDITVNPAKFLPSSVTEETDVINAVLEKATSSGPSWTTVGAAEYRALGDAGKTAFPPPILVPGAHDIEIPSRDGGRSIPVRVYKPDNGLPSRAVLLHIHGGGFVLATHRHQDPALQRYANSFQVTAVSVGYRLAPENVYPAAAHDCFDVATHLVDNGESLFGAPLRILVGESAGGCLAAQTAFHLIRQRPSHPMAGMVLPYGWFDLTLNLPSMVDFKRQLIISTKSMREFAEAYTPGMSIEERRRPEVSPLYEDLHGLAKAAAGGKLPRALFLVGTEDPLLDDTVLMSAKWLATGSEAVVQVYPGAPHVFNIVPGYGPADDAAVVVKKFVGAALDDAEGTLPN